MFPLFRPTRGPTVSKRARALVSFIFFFRFIFASPATTVRCLRTARVDVERVLAADSTEGINSSVEIDVVARVGTRLPTALRRNLGIVGCELISHR